MKTVISALIFISFSTIAQQYVPPKVVTPSWDKQKKTQIKQEKWLSDYSIKEYKHPHDADNSKNAERKPSSGDESKKPKFWDFKVVK